LGSHLIDGVSEPTTHHVIAEEINGAFFVCLLPLARQAAGEIVDLARGVVVGHEVERIEPRSGSRAHVAEVIPAVDDHRPGLVELRHRLGIELLQGDVDRAGQVLLGVLLCGQHLNQLGPLIQEPAKALVIDPLEHQAARSSFARIQLSGGVRTRPSSVR
jgi:hypothetical protein